MSNRILPAFLKTPELPQKTEGVLSWIRSSLYVFLSTIYRTLADRSEEMVQEGLSTLMPTASGRRRFYYATDTDDLYYDSGTWKKVHFT